MRPRRRPEGRPPKADAPKDRHYLKALRLRVCLKLTEVDAAAVMGVSRPTLRAWCRKAMRLPEAKQILTDESHP